MQKKIIYAKNAVPGGMPYPYNRGYVLNGQITHNVIAEPAVIKNGVVTRPAKKTETTTLPQVDPDDPTKTYSVTNVNNYVLDENGKPIEAAMKQIELGSRNGVNVRIEGPIDPMTGAYIAPPDTTWTTGPIGHVNNYVSRKDVGGALFDLLKGYYEGDRQLPPAEKNHYIEKKEC